MWLELAFFRVIQLHACTKKGSQVLIIVSVAPALVYPRLTNSLNRESVNLGYTGGGAKVTI